MRDNRPVDRTDRTLEGDRVDVTVLLAAVVAVLILAAGYLLFNDVPTFGKSPGARRPPRRP